MSEKSSRSHLVFFIIVESCKAGPDGKHYVKRGKLNLVDLAGSEAHNQIKATGIISKEAVNINISKSLITLGNVISALINPNSLHIPYRDSKLTRILQDSLGGTAKAVLIANIRSADWNYEDTLHTLRFANRVKSIKNKPRVNEDPWGTFLGELQEEIEKLKAQLEKEKEEMIKSTERERNIIEAQEDLSDADKQRLLGDLAMREEAWRADPEQERMLRKLQKLEKYILKGSQTVEYDYKEQEETEKTKKELEEKDGGIRKISSQLHQSKIEMKRPEEDFDEERASYLKQISHLKSQLKLKDRIINHFLPNDVVAKIEAQSRWDEQKEDWVLQNIGLSQESLIKPAPSLGFTRPMPDYVRKNQDSSFSWKLRSENILDVESDMPGNTMEGFDGRRLSHIKKARRIGMDEDEDELEILNDLKRLNIYEDDREEEKVMDHSKAAENMRKGIYVPKRVGSHRKRREESPDREEEEFTTLSSDEDF